MMNGVSGGMAVFGPQQQQAPMRQPSFGQAPGQAGGSMWGGGFYQPMGGFGGQPFGGGMFNMDGAAGSGGGGTAPPRTPEMRSGGGVAPYQYQQYQMQPQQQQWLGGMPVGMFGSGGFAPQGGTPATPRPLYPPMTQSSTQWQTPNGQPPNLAALYPWMSHANDMNRRRGVGE